MSCESSSIDPNREKSIVRVTLLGAAMNCVLTFAKIAAGFLGNSAAMIADGIHSLSDLVSDFIVVFFVRVSSKMHDEDHNYGHGKYETLATLIVSLMLLIVGVKLLFNGIDAVSRYLAGEQLGKPTMIALYMAALSIAVKEGLFQITARVGKKVNSQVVVANAWHHRTDAISSVGSLLGIAGAIFLGDKWVVLDPLAGCLISVFIFIVAFKMASGAMNELMEAALPEAEQQEISRLIMSVSGIQDVHNLKTRKNGQSVIIDVHIVVAPSITVAVSHEMTIQAERLLYDRFGEMAQIYIHVEPSTASL